MHWRKGLLSQHLCGSTARTMAQTELKEPLAFPKPAGRISAVFAQAELCLRRRFGFLHLGYRYEVITTME